MIALIASVFALGVGPLIYQTFGPLRRTDRIVSGFILVVIAMTLFVEVLPETFSVIGYPAIILALVGFAGPTVIEKSFTKSATKTHKATIFLGILGLILHATLDGAALQNANTFGHHDNLTLAIILHRLPVGLTIWWLLKPLIGERFALLTLVGMAIATNLGFALSIQLEAYNTNIAFVGLQSFIAGSLLHVVLHKPHPDGCMHTSIQHQRSHAHHHKVNKEVSTNDLQNKKRFLQRVMQKLPDQWEFIGMLIGITTMSALHFFL